MRYISPLHLTRIVTFLVHLTKATTSATTSSKESQVGGLCLDFENFVHFNEWSNPSGCGQLDSSGPFRRSFSAVASYQRGPKSAPLLHQDNIKRVILFGGVTSPGSTESLGDTWLYNPVINAWNRPQLHSHPYAREGHTMNTLCEYDVILFGGGSERTGNLFNDTWRFDGVTETWHELTPGSPNGAPAPRYSHSAVVLLQHESKCVCRESVFIYGGLGFNGTCTSDLWELRCTRDSETKDKYQWIHHKTRSPEDQPAGRLFHTAAEYNKTVMYIWGGYRCALYSNWAEKFSFPETDMWLYNATSSSWRLIENTFNFAQIYDAAVYYKKIDSIVVVAKYHSVSMRPVNGTLEVIDILSRLIKKGSRDIISNAVRLSAVVLNDDILLYGQGSHGYSGDFSFWNLTFLDEQRGWLLLPNAISVSGPTAFRGIPDNYRLAGQSLYAFGGDVLVPLSDYATAANVVWQFDLLSKTWWQTWSVFSPPSLEDPASAVVKGSLILLFGGNSSKEDLPNSGTQDYGYPEKNYSVIWAYDTGIRRWMLYTLSRLGHEFPSDRVDSSLSDLGNGSLFLFGGKSSTPLNDFWRLDFNFSREFRPVWTNCVRWYRLHDTSGAEGYSRYPIARHSHSTAVVGDFFVVFGGATSYNNSVMVLSDMFVYTISKETWMRVKQSGFVPLPTYPVRLSSAQVGNKTVVVLPGKWSEGHNSVVLTRTLVFDLRSLTWTRLIGVPFNALSLLTWEGRLVVFGVGQDSNGHETNLFSFMNPSCPAGQTSRNWAEDECAVCSIGMYAELGYQECRACPAGLTTLANGSMSSSSCTCPDDYCQYGVCYVTHDASQLSSICSCDFGFTGGRCQYPTYYVIGASVLSAIILVTVLGLFLKRMIHYKTTTKEVQQELRVAYNVWSISEDEVELGQRIDGDTPGSYGDVYSAHYKEILVAVKTLKMEMMNDRMKKEFEREIEVMRSIRHPNIVMFFGAGELDNGSLFLVVEFLSRGSLKSILDNTNIHLSYQQRLSFALDASKGMSFLHSLVPPRIHRDLKSCNLLVNSRWIVKVADFGSARIVPRERERFPTATTAASLPSGDDVRLLQATALLTGNTGTVLWRSPELFAREAYGTSSDVYSFGIVLWELLSRKMPFDDRSFCWIDDVGQAVQSGIRPTIEQPAPADYVILIENCWHTNPDMRPTFREVTTRLSQMTRGQIASAAHLSSELQAESTT